MAIPRSLLWFADAMGSRLEENQHKGGWHDETFAYLLTRLRQETRELADELKKADAMTLSTVNGEASRGRIAQEAADVANFAYMIAVNANGGDIDL